MFRNQMVLQAKGDKDRLYAFTCDPSAPLAEVAQALIAMKNIVDQMIKEAEENAKAEPSETNDEEQKEEDE